SQPADHRNRHRCRRPDRERPSLLLGVDRPAGYPPLSPVSEGHRQDRAQDLQRQGNWQATQKDMVNFLFFNGDKIKEGRAPGNALFEPSSARYNQGNFYTDSPLHGLWKWEDNRIFSNDLFVTGKYA